MVFLAHDASPNLTKKIQDKSHYYQVEVITVFSTLELSTAVGKSRKVLAITDAGFTKKMSLLWNRRGGHDLSKKRLYEIAKELGKESKEVVARAKELGLDVKSHSSSVEEAVAAKIAASFKSAAPKVEAKPAEPKASTEKKAEKSEPAKPAVAKEEAKPAEPVAPKAEKVATKPQSRNFKAEREARAKEQAERRKQNKGNNRDHQQNGNRQKNDNRNGGKQGQGNRDNRRFNDQAKKQQGQQNRGNERRQQEDKRPNQSGPRVDFKARAAALKQSKMQSTHAQARSASNNRKQPKKPWLKLTNARNQRKSLKKLLS